MASPSSSCESADTPVGRSIATTGTPSPLTSATTVSSRPGQRTVEPGADDGVDDQVALGDLAEVQLPFLRVGDLDDGQADAAEDLEVGARVAAHVADAAEQEDGRLDAALRQRPRDDEAVAAVVAAPAQHADPARGEVLERRLHRRDRLAAGVLHQHDRGQADFVDRLPVGFPHLLRIQHAHVVTVYVGSARCEAGGAGGRSVIRRA